MHFKIIDHFGHGCQNAVDPLAVQPAETGVGFGKAQPVQQDCIVVIFQRSALEMGLSLLGGLDRIACEHPLVDQLRGRQCRLVAEQDVEKLQAIDVPADDDQAHRERG